MIFKSLIVSLTTLLPFSTGQAEQELISLFPLDHYDQTVSAWIKPTAPDYDKPLLETAFQQQKMADFYDHYFGSTSPWNPDYVKRILHPAKPDDLATLEQSVIDFFSNNNKPTKQMGYGENFRLHDQDWINAIASNINISQLDNLNYAANHRGITIDNLHARGLPTNDPHYYNHKLAGQGYPFDNLQMSAVWAGTPVYILSETVDHAWCLVITPDFIAWVKSSGIAKVNNAFVDQWQTAAKKHLAAITQTKTSIVDEKGIFRFSAYIGTVLPASEKNGRVTLLIPIVDAQGNAEAHRATVTTQQAALMPLSATPHHFADLMQNLHGRPYGWGNMYFYNDCSAELKSLYTPFGIWVPRHSADQVTIGQMVDMTSYPADQRLSYLLQNGHKFLTLIYIGGHIIMYMGNYPNPNSQNHEDMAMTYQNVWGLSPSPAASRVVIGQSVLFPMLLQYPEDTNLVSLANKKYFQIAYLDAAPNNFMMQPKFINLKSLLFNME